MNTPSTMLLQPAALELLEEDGPGQLIEAAFRYDAHDPYAVSLVLKTSQAPVVWTFARQLLSDGLEGPAGDGDVHVWPGATDSGMPLVFIEMTTADQDMLLAALPLDVTSFLDASHEIVRPGDESAFLDVDAAIAAILATAEPGR